MTGINVNMSNGVAILTAFVNGDDDTACDICIGLDRINMVAAISFLGTAAAGMLRAAAEGSGRDVDDLLQEVALRFAAEVVDGGAG